MEAANMLLDAWGALSFVAKTSLVVLVFSVVNVVYTNLTRNYVDGKRIPKGRIHYLPFSLDVVLFHAFIGPVVDKYYGGFGHYARLTRLCKEFGGIFSSSAANQRAFLINEPEQIKHVTATNFSNYEKGPAFTDTMAPFLGHGIFNSNGNAWRNQRNIAKTHFQREDITSMVDIFLKHSAVMTSLLDQAARPAGTTPSQPRAVEVQDLFQRLTLDSVGDILFGFDFHSLTSASSFARSFDYLQQKSVYRLRNPLWRFTSFLSQSSYDEHLAHVHKIVEKIVQTCLTDPRLYERQDMLAHFVQSRDENGEVHSVEYLRDACLNFLLAGRDTTAALLTWTLYCLSEHPEVERKLVEEIDTVLQGREPTADDLRNLRYMRLVLSEVLRLYPSVPMNVRTAVEDDYLPTGEFVPKNTNMVFSQFVVSRLPEFFGPDAEKFDPERWSDDRVSSIRPFYFFAFHAGPRICLGQQMALTEAKLALAVLYQRYRIRQADPQGQRISVLPTLILTNRYGMNMTFERR